MIINWLLEKINIADQNGPNDHRHWVIDPFDPEKASPFKPRIWRLWWAYKGGWLGLWFSGVIAMLLSLAVALVFVPITGWFTFWIALIIQPVVIVALPLVLFGTKCWYNPEKSLKYLEMLSNWPIAVTEGIGDPELKHPAVKPMPVFSGVVTIDTPETQTLVYDDRQVELRYNWAVAIIVDKLENLLHKNSKFAQDFPELKLYQGEIETTDTGTPRLSPENAVRERIQTTMFFRRAIKEIPGILQAQTHGQPWEKMQRKEVKVAVAKAVDAVVREKLQLLDEDGNPINPGVEVRFLPQDIEPPDYISETIARKVVAKAEGERSAIVLELLVDALRKHAKLNREQIAKVVMANFLSKGEGGAILGLDIFGGSQSSGKARKRR